MSLGGRCKGIIRIVKHCFFFGLYNSRKKQTFSICSIMNVTARHILDNTTPANVHTGEKYKTQICYLIEWSNFWTTRCKIPQIWTLLRWKQKVKVFRTFLQLLCNALCFLADRRAWNDYFVLGGIVLIQYHQTREI